MLLNSSSGLLTLLIVLIFLLGYLIGSIPFGLIIAKIAGHGDIREIGSGNIGATNVLRTGSKKLAALTLFADIIKGMIPIIVMLYVLPKLAPYALIAGFGAFIGHLYPVWLKFKGGKGVATFLGILLAYSWVLGLVFALGWLTTAYISRISSFAALSASLITLVTSFILGLSSILLTAMVALIYWKHRENINRLMDGTESRIGKGK